MRLDQVQTVLEQLAVHISEDCRKTARAAGRRVYVDEEHRRAEEFADWLWAKFKEEAEP